VASHGSTGAASHDVDIEHINQKPNHVDGGFEKSGGGLESARPPACAGARLGESENSTDTSKGSPSRPLQTISENVQKKSSVHRASDLAKQMGLKIPVPKYQPSQCDGLGGNCSIPVLNGDRYCVFHSQNPNRMLNSAPCAAAQDRKARQMDEALAGSRFARVWSRPSKVEAQEAEAQ
jgi:hypothetical protein